MFKIYVGNLDYKVRIEQLRELFSVFAPIEDLVIPLDPRTNRSKGFAIVMIRDPELGQAAIKAMQGKRLLGRTLVINEAVKRKKQSEEAPMSKSDLLRNGPFGPRMYRSGESRGGSRTNRNPRRSLGGRADSGGGGNSRGPGDGPHGIGKPSGGSAESGPADGPTSGARGPASGLPRPTVGTPPAPPPTGARSAPSASVQPPLPQPATQQPARPKAQRLAQPRRVAEKREPPADPPAASGG